MQLERSSLTFGKWVRCICCIDSPGPPKGNARWINFSWGNMQSVHWIHQPTASFSFTQARILISFHCHNSPQKDIGIIIPFQSVPFLARQMQHNYLNEDCHTCLKTLEKQRKPDLFPFNTTHIEENQGFMHVWNNVTPPNGLSRRTL